MKTKSKKQKTPARKKSLSKLNPEQILRRLDAYRQFMLEIWRNNPKLAPKK